MQTRWSCSMRNGNWRNSILTLRHWKRSASAVGADCGVPRPLRVQTARGSVFFRGSYTRRGRRISSDVAPTLKAAMPETGDWNTSHVRISLANCLIYGPPLTVFVRMHCLSPVRLGLCNYYFFSIPDSRFPKLLLRHERREMRHPAIVIVMNQRDVANRRNC